MKVDVFFSKTTVKPQIIQSRIQNQTVLITVLFPSVYGPCFWLKAGPPLSLFTIKMAKIWQNRGALHGVQGRVPTNFILYVSTLMLALLSYYDSFLDQVPHLRKQLLTLGMSRFAHSGVWQEIFQKSHSSGKL